jgi:LPS sulfotransferase NodH
LRQFKLKVNGNLSKWQIRDFGTESNLSGPAPSVLLKNIAEQACSIMIKNISKFLIKKKINDCFVIFSAPRTGSNLLCGCLNSHPEIICHHELFNPEDIYYSLDHRNNDFEFSKKDRDENPLQFIASISGKRFGKKILGFKMMPGHNRDAEDFVLKNKNIKKIILNRENKIKTFVSLRIAQKTNCFSSFEEKKEQTYKNHTEKIIVNLEELKKYIIYDNVYYNKIKHYLTKTNQNYIYLTYEEFTSAESNSIKREILEYLNVEPNPELIKTRHVKQNPDNLCELIENYDEIKSLMQGSPLERFLL